MVNIFKEMAQEGLNTTVLTKDFNEVNRDSKEALVLDFQSICGYCNSDAIKAADNVIEFDYTY